MKITGTRTEHVEVEVTPQAMGDKLIEHFRAFILPDDVKATDADSAIITEKGEWELWTDGHGSGYTRVLRPATGPEISNYNVYQDACVNIRSLLNRELQAKTATLVKA